MNTRYRADAAVGRDVGLGGGLEGTQLQHLGRDVEAGHRRGGGVALHRQQVGRGLVEARAQHVDLGDDLVHPVGDQPAALGGPVGVLPDLGQVGLRAGRRVQAHRLHHPGEVGEGVAQLGHRGIQASAGPGRLQLPGQVLDLGKRAVVYGPGPAGTGGSGSGLHDGSISHTGVAVQRGRHRADPANMSRAAPKVGPSTPPSRLMAMTSLAATSTLRTQLVAAVSPRGISANASIIVWMMVATWFTWPRTSVSPVASESAPSASRSQVLAALVDQSRRRPAGSRRCRPGRSPGTPRAPHPAGG